MGKHLYLDCVSGIAGDMTLAALIDAGADIEYIASHLRRLPFDPFELSVREIVKRGIAAKHLVLSFPQAHDEHHHDHKHYHEHHQHHEQEHHHEHHQHRERHHEHHRHDHHHDHGHEHRKASAIIEGIERSDLPERVKLRSVKVFRVIAEAEGKIHGLPPEDVHFHEVGAMDSIIDIVGVCLALESLGIDSISASPVPTGSGKIRMAHGLYPIPAPATAELLRGIPLARLDAVGELTTPTGAGILRALADRFGALPEGTIDRIGYGAGKKDFEHPNVLRCYVMNEPNETGRQSIKVLEAQLDDCTGEMMGYTMERLFGAGALDVYFTSVYMKKNRPGVLITVLAEPEHARQCELLLLSETTTLGVRSCEWTRSILERRHVRVETRFGPVRVKQAVRGGVVIHQAPEYEDAATAAREYGVPLQTVYEEAIRKTSLEPTPSNEA